MATVAPSRPATAPARVDGRRSRVLRAYAAHASAYRRTWRSSVVSALLSPTLYLAAMGVGLGSLVNKHTGGSRLGGADYLGFVAPGLVAATAMQIGANDGSWPVMAGIKWLRSYHAQLASPLTVDDVTDGQLLWIATRLTGASALYLAVVAAFGAIASPWAVLALPAAALTGLAFAAPIAAFAATQENDSSFSVIFRFVIMPLFLFSGTFFPITQLPGAIQPLAYAVPLWHGVSLCRDLTLGHPALADSLAHVGYLLLWVVAGVVAARITFRRRLVI